MDKIYYDATPNVKAIFSLRTSQSSNEHAIADIIDNSFDANATVAIITIDKKDCVTIFDDGKGMSLDTMVKALTLGSDTDHANGDLGKFGMGLKLSGISMGNRIELLSKEDGEDPHKAILDLDDMEESKKWGVWEEPLTDEEKRDFANIAHGTFVRILKPWNVKNQIVGCTSNYLRRAFRNFLKDGKTILINGKALTPIDPLERGEKGTVIHYDESVKLNGKKVRFTVAEVRTDGSDIAASKDNDGKLKVGLQNQGFFVVRNGREIKGPDYLDIWDRHPGANRFRCEISFDEASDVDFGVPPTKDDITLSDAMKLSIVKIVGKYHTLIMAKGNKKKALDEAKEVDHSDAESIIAGCKNLDIKKAKKEKRKSPKVKNVAPVPKPPKPDDPNKKKKIRRNFRFIQPSANSMPAEFQEVALGEYGRLFDCYFDKGKVVVRWNYEHPFYEKLIARYRKDKNVLTPIDLMAYSLSIELLTADTEELELAMDNAIDVMSGNLGKLINNESENS